MAYTHVLTPIRLGPVEVKNRVVRTAHTTMIGGGTVNDALIDYHQRRAIGGVGLSVIEAMAVHPSSVATLNAFDPRLQDAYPPLVERMRPHGMKVFQQLFHAGHNGQSADGGPPWAPSDIPGWANGAPPLAMSKGMIDEVVESYANAARMCADWGLDGVEVHCAHGFLIQQFLSTYANDREDDYGGPIENRARFMLEVLRAVRGALPGSMALGIRVAPDLMPGGVGIDDNLWAAQAAAKEGLADYVSISSATFQTFPKMIGGMHERAGFELETSAPITTKLELPTIVIGRFRTLEEADQVIRAGEGDMVGMVRATIADPDLVAKSQRGEPQSVRPCIACNQGCIGQLLGAPGRMGCAVNPAVGFEATLSDEDALPVIEPHKVLVVGGGPAGMEAARVAARRGHHVVLAEAAPRLGGTISLAARAPTRAGLRDITEWLEQEVYRLGVEVRLSTYMDADDIAAEQADTVILATGASPRMDGVQLSNPGEAITGMDLPHVLSSTDLLAAPDRDFGKHAVVIDDLGHYEAVGAAEFLAARGATVTYLTRHTAFAPLMEPALMNEPALRRMDGAIDVHLRTRAIAIDRESVLAGPTYLPAQSNASRRFRADTVVFVSHNRPNRDLAEALVARGIEARSIGDANTPRYLPAAIREGRIAGLAA
ncbi:FAD-dependent oxidoreductase [Novosphingobium tardum]|uniref:FAD-dependent oxidoreductase n=1 Tax=Novosphingobium tardum TaxID=1538021 RepID=A0ABV8RRH1_9SPHN